MSRSIAAQTLDELGGPRSVLARQRRDHVQLDRLLPQLQATTGTTQEGVLQRIDRLVFSHAFAEETVLWPVLRRVLPGGGAATLPGGEGDQEGHELVTPPGKGGPDDPPRPPRRGPPVDPESKRLNSRPRNISYAV